MGRLLITTADERSWRFDCPVLFLGEWCRTYDRRQVWQEMDGLVAGPYGLQPGQKERDLAYMHAMFSQLLDELADALNVFHHTSHGLRYWHIVLGHWLQRYVSVMINRYFTLEQALKNYEISESVVFDFGGYSPATNDTFTFIWALNDHVWNHVLCAKIIEYLGGIKVEKSPVRVAGFLPIEKRPAASRRGAGRLAKDAVTGVLRVFSRKGDGFIINSYLPTTEEARLQLSLGQCPQIWQSPAVEWTAPDREARGRLQIDAEKHAGFERFVRRQLAEMLPTCYTEDYARLVQQADALPWPAEPKFIFTSNNFDTDDVFKVWTASKVEQGTPYFTGQHGNNYGTALGSPNCVECLTADKFFTWGWTNGSEKNVPAFVFKTAARRLKPRQSNGGLLLVEMCMQHRMFPWDIYWEFGVYQEEQFRFVQALPEPIQKRLTVRLQAEYKRHEWSDEDRWRDRSPQIRLETGVDKIQKLIGESRLVVHSYDSTGMLETLACNIPTICFWHGGLDHLLPGTKPYYEHLKRAGILFDTPEEAAGKVASHWDNVALWWQSDAVQDARKIFCGQYAKTVSSPVRTLNSLIKKALVQK